MVCWNHTQMSWEVKENPLDNEASFHEFSRRQLINSRRLSLYGRGAREIGLDRPEKIFSRFHVFSMRPGMASAMRATI